MSNQCKNPLDNPKCKEVVKTEGHYLCRSCGIYGRKYTIEHRKLISESRIKGWKNGEYEDTKKIWSKNRSGKGNPMYGKKQTDNAKRLMSENHADISGKNNVNFGKTYEEIYGIMKSLEIKNKLKVANLGKSRSIESRKKQTDTIIQKKYNISYDEYLNTLDDKDRYYKLVRDITKQQPIYLLENYDKRGRADLDGNAYHLDHKISISYGFHNNISPKEIGDINNLRFIYWKDNIIKQGDNYYG